MKEYGNICELHLYEGEEHGFFNYGMILWQYQKDILLRQVKLIKEKI